MRRYKRGKLIILFSILLIGIINSNIIENPVVIVSKTGNQMGGIEVYCPEGYVIASGGFLDAGDSNDDQDWNTPINIPFANGWYCKEDYSFSKDKSADDSKCFAVCIREELVKTKIEKKTGSQEKGVFVDCGENILLGGGFGNEFRNNHDQDYAHPKDNGWYCQEDRSSLASRCYALCAEPLENYNLTCQTISIRGNQNEGVFVECPEGYFITGGGFNDGGNLDDDQDASHPLDNGWYCKDYLSTNDSECYARCCTTNLFDGSEKECETDNDCGESYYENNYCEGNNIYRNLITPFCDEGVCGVKVVKELIEECKKKCKDGMCIEEKSKEKRSNIRSKNIFTRTDFGCEPNWKCMGWGECIEGIMTRICEDLNHCGTEYNKPLERVGCQKEIIKSSLIEEKENNLFLIIGIVIAIILLIILLILFLRF